MKKDNPMSVKERGELSRLAKIKKYGSQEEFLKKQRDSASKGGQSTKNKWKTLQALQEDLTKVDKV